MRREDAIALVQSRREALDLEPELSLGDAELAWVEILKDREKPGTPRDHRAWIVTFDGSLGYARVIVDDGTGEILEVQRSK
jgi:hypothetical protein